MKQKGEEKRVAVTGFAASVARGVIVGMCVIIILFAVSAALITSGMIPESYMKVVVWISGFFGSLIGSVIAIRSRGSNALAVGGSVGGTIFVLTLIGAAFSESGGLIGSVTPGLIVALLLGSVAGSFLGTGKRKRKRG